MFRGTDYIAHLINFLKHLLADGNNYPYFLIHLPTGYSFNPHRFLFIFTKTDRAILSV